MKKLSYLLASTVSALTAILPLSATARTTDLAIRNPSASTETARLADTIKVSDAAKQQIAKKARGQTPPSTQPVGEQSAHPLQGLLFREEIPQVRRKAPRFGEEIPSISRGVSFGGEIPQIRRRGAPPFGEEIPQVRR